MVNDIAYEADGKIVDINTTIIGNIIIALDGALNSQGNVVVKIHGVDTVTKGKIRKSCFLIST